MTIERSYSVPSLFMSIPRFPSCVLILLLLGFLVRAASESENLLKNSDFTVVDGKGKPASWAVPGNKAAEQELIVDTDPVEGTCVRLRCTRFEATRNSNVMISQPGA